MSDFIDSNHTDITGNSGYEIADFAEIPGTPCPCGTARRAFSDIEDFPATVHVTEISVDAQKQ